MIDLNKNPHLYKYFINPTDFDISTGLKNHYLFEYPIKTLIYEFSLIFEKQKFN